VGDWAILYGVEHERLDEIAVEAVSATTAIALSRGRYPKRYRHSDPNEDVVACLSDDRRTILVVADGHNGRESSSEAVASVVRGFATVESPPSIASFVELFHDAHEAICAATAPAGARSPESRTALAVAVIEGATLYWASFGDCDIFLCGDASVEPLSPLRSYFLGWPMTRAELGDKLATGTTELADGDAVLVASDGLRDFADPVGRGLAAVSTLVRSGANGAEVARGLVELACVGRAGDNVAVAVALASRR
jgi:serine/threonine protein phosphatase PrpC